MSHTYSYDEVPYLSMPVRETDPLAMAFMAALFGVDAPDPRSCDLLELGCGDGGNLMSLGSAYPGIRAVGFDPARAAVQRGREVLERTGLGNVVLHDDEAAVDLNGTMDYVYAHGVLSWVDEDVCADVVAAAARAARPGGLVSFSYRVFPFAHYEQPGRELAQRAIQAAERRAAERGEVLTWQDKVRVARERIKVAVAISTPAPHGQAMETMAAKWDVMPDWSVYHDDLSEPLHPKRATEVAEMAAAHGLKYLGELLPQDLWQVWFPEDFCESIRNEAGPDALRRRQLLDDLGGMAFHSSLFVKADEAPELEPSFGDREIYVRQYVHGTPDGEQLSNEVSPQVARAIAAHHPAAVTAAQLAEDLGFSAAQVERELLRLHTHGLVRLSTVPPPVAAAPGERPRAMPLAVEQIDQHQNFASSRFHYAVGMAPTPRAAILRMADGTRDRAALRRDVPEYARANGMSDGLAEHLAQIDAVLEELALSGLLADPAS